MAYFQKASIFPLQEIPFEVYQQECPHGASSQVKFHLYQD